MPLPSCAEEVEQEVLDTLAQGDHRGGEIGFRDDRVLCAVVHDVVRLHRAVTHGAQNVSFGHLAITAQVVDVLLLGSYKNFSHL